MRLTIIGCGSIGRTLALYLENEDNIESICMMDRKREAVAALEEETSKVKFSENIEEAIEKSDLIVEMA